MTNSGVRKARKKVELRECVRCGKMFEESKSQCTYCKAWNNPAVIGNDETILLSEVEDKPLPRIEGTGPWDKCFSRDGGIVTVSATLVGGAPGAGKSTMALQLADKIAEITAREILYIAAEEAKEQVKDRAQRLRLKQLAKIRILPMGAGGDLGHVLVNRKPSAVIVDSLPGLTEDEQYAVLLCKRFKEYAVSLSAPFIIIDHITKADDLAGLMKLQHEVDTTLLFNVLTDEKKTRVITIKKNRFGPDNRTCFLEMTNEGLIEADIPDDSDDESDSDWDDD